MQKELSNYDWQDAIDAIKWPLNMDTMPAIDLRFDMFDGNAKNLVQSYKDKLETFEKGTYNHDYAVSRLNALFKAYL
jgi:hypothetical protein